MSELKRIADALEKIATVLTTLIVRNDTPDTVLTKDKYEWLAKRGMIRG